MVNVPPPKPPVTRPVVPGAVRPVLLHDAARPKVVFAQLASRPLAKPLVARAEAPPHAPAGVPTDAHARKAPKEERREDPLDPAVRQLAHLAPPPPPPPCISPTAEAAIAPRTRVSLEELLPQLVRRIAWAGDRRRGSVQLELGAGPHAGAIVTVHADDGRVRVEVQGSDELRARIAAAGLPVDG